MLKKEVKSVRMSFAMTKKMYKDIKRLNIDIATICRESVDKAIKAVLKDTKAK